MATFPDLADRDTLAVLQRAPTPAAGAALTRSQVRAALTAGGRRRNLDTRAAIIVEGLRVEARGPTQIIQAG